MEEAGLFFYSSEAASSVIFRFITKQEFENVGVTIPGSPSAPSKVATINLLSGEPQVIGVAELMATASVRSVGFRPLVKNRDYRTCESNLLMQAQKLLLAGDNKTPEVVPILSGEKTPTTERLKNFVSELELTSAPGKISIRVLEELSQIESEASPLSVYATLFKSWFTGGEIADLLTTLVSGKGEHFLPLSYRGIKSEKRMPREAELRLVQDFLAKTVADRLAAVRLTDAASSDRLAAVRLTDAASSDRPVAKRPTSERWERSLSKITEWVSGALGMLYLPELPIIDLGPLLSLADIQPSQHCSRSCIVTTKLAAKIQPHGDVVIDRDGFGLNFLTAAELEELDAALVQSCDQEDQKLRTLVARLRAT